MRPPTGSLPGETVFLLAQLRPSNALPTHRARRETRPRCKDRCRQCTRSDTPQYERRDKRSFYVEPAGDHLRGGSAGAGRAADCWRHWIRDVTHGEDHRHVRFLLTVHDDVTALVSFHLLSEQLRIRFDTDADQNA